jgi:hypothetical protein
MITLNILNLSWSTRQGLVRILYFKSISQRVFHSVEINVSFANWPLCLQYNAIYDAVICTPVSNDYASFPSK